MRPSILLTDLPFFEAVTEAFSSEPEATALTAFEETPPSDNEDCRYVYLYRGKTGA